MSNWLMANLPKSILDEVQILCRPQELDSSRIPFLWIHDMPADVPFIVEPSTRALFERIIFVSAWQQTIFNVNAGVPFSEGFVLRNAIDPIVPIERNSQDPIRLIYHPTPHRGLEILVNVFMELCYEHDDIMLDVYSNFDLYARPESNRPFEPLYEICREHPQINYFGSRSNDEVRRAVARADIFAYPSIWRETSCLTAMEAMSGRCLVVAPYYGALTETLANYGLSYCWTENQFEHAERFKTRLSDAINAIRTGSAEQHMDNQKAYADKFYNRSDRLIEWELFLTKIIENQDIPRRGGVSWMP